MSREPRADRYRRILRTYNECSREAWESIADYLPKIDELIVAVIGERAYVANVTGLSSEEIESRTGLKHQTVSAQIRHLVEAGILEAAGKGRNAAGRSVTLWKLTSAAQGQRSEPSQASLVEAEA